MNDPEIQKIEFDAFIGKDSWPILTPFVEDKQYGGYIELGEVYLLAEPGRPDYFEHPAKSWPPYKVKVTIERVFDQPPQVKVTKKTKKKGKKQC